MRIEILRQAEEELLEAIKYYERITPGLGIRLKKEVKHSIQWIKDNPTTANTRPKGYRRINLRVFPYYLAYAVHNKMVWILAIAHVKRHPEYWIRRKK